MVSIMVFSHLQQYPLFNKAEIPNTAEPRYLTTEDFDEIFRNNRNSMEYVSEFESSTDDSTRSSFWESSTLDDSTETGSESSSIPSGSEPEEAGLLQPRKASAVKRVSSFAKSSPAKRILLESKSLSSSSDEETSNKDGDEGDKHSSVEDREVGEAEEDEEDEEVEEDGKAKKHPEARGCQAADGQLEIGEVERHQGGKARLLLEYLDQQSRLVSQTLNFILRKNFVLYENQGHTFQLA